MPAPVGPGKFTQNFAANTEFNSTSGVYEIGASVTVNAGVTLQIDPGVTVLIDEGDTLTVQGALTVGNGATVEVVDGGGVGTNGVPAGITVNGGSLMASGASFVRQNNTGGTDLTSLQVINAGQVFLAGSNFSWDQLSLSAAAGGAVYSDTFASTLAIDSAATAPISLNDFSSASTTVVASGAAGTSVNLLENYWGTTNTTAIEAKITDSHTNSALPTVDFAQPLASMPSAAATSTSVGDASVTFSPDSQSVTLNANVSTAAGTVNEGTATFTVLGSNGQVVGHPSGGAVSGGLASVLFTLPASLAAGQYTVLAVYNGDTNYQASVSISPAAGRLTVQAASTTTVTSNVSVAASPIEQVVTLNATVTSGGAGVSEGTVTFTVFAPGNVQVGNPAVSAPVFEGNAGTNLALPAGLAQGTYTVQAVYNAGPDYQTSSDSTHTLTVGQPVTTTVVDKALISYTQGLQGVTLSAVVTGGGGGVSEGSVTFYITTAAGLQVGAPVNSGSVVRGIADASFTVPAGLAPGTYNIDGIYTPGPDYLGSSDATATLTDNPTTPAVAATATTAGLSPNPESVTLLASVTASGAGVVQGSVTFTVLTALGVQVGTPVTSPLVFGNATGVYTLPGGLVAGTYTIQAVYNGDANYRTTSDSTHKLTVGQAATSITDGTCSMQFYQNANSAPTYAAVTSGGSDIGEGTLTFSLFSPANVLVGAPVTYNVSSTGNFYPGYTLPAAQAPGAYTMQVAFSGDPSYLASTSSYTVDILPEQTTTVASSASVSLTGSRSVTLNAAVRDITGSVPVNQGTVTFTVLGAGNVQVGSPVTSGTVSFGNASSVYTLPAGQAQGTYTIKAVYNPGPDYSTSSDSTHTLAAGAPATATVASSASVPYSFGSQVVPLSATVTSNGAGVNEGTVTFTVFGPGDAQVGTAVTSGTVSGGNATANFTVPGAQPQYIYTIRAVYNPGPDYQTSSDSSRTLTVAPAAASTTAAYNTSVSYSPNSQPVVLSALVTSNASSVNEGQVSFTLFSGSVQVGLLVTSGTVFYGTASAVYTLPAGLAQGTYTIQAVYDNVDGGDFFSSADSTHTLTVGPAGTATVTAVNASAPYLTGARALFLNASVTSGGVGVNEGSVTFTVYSGSAVVGVPVTSAPVSDGNAATAFTVPAGQTAGTYSILAVYNPGPDYPTTSDYAHTLTIDQDATSTVASNESFIYNAVSEPQTFSAAVTSGGVGVNEGSVTFTLFAAGNVQVTVPFTSSVTNGLASISASELPEILPYGTYTIQAVYNPGPDYLGSSDSTHTLSVAKAATNISLFPTVAGVSPSPLLVTLNATITATEGTATFTVLTEGNAQVGVPVTVLVGGDSGTTAVYTLPADLATGTYTVQVVYSPGPDYLGSSYSTQALTVEQSATTITAASGAIQFSQNPEAATLTCSVTSNGDAVDEGTVTYSVVGPGNVLVGAPVTISATANPDNGVAYPLPAGQPGGVYTVQIAYSGGIDFLPSSNSSTTLTINNAPTTTVVSNASASFSSHAQSITLSANVTDVGVPVNQGTVTFTVFAAGNVQVGSPVTSGTVSNGTASATFTLPAGQAQGTYSIHAVYTGGPVYTTSSDSSHTLTVGAAPATTTVASNASTGFSPNSQSVTLSATVAGGGVGVGEGTVTFTVFAAGNVQVGSPVISGTVSDGNASATFTLPAGAAAGTYTIQAVYNAGPDYQTSSDSTHTLTVSQAATTTAASNASANFSPSSQSVTLSASVTTGGVGVSEGTVTFTVFGPGNVQVGNAVTSGTVAAGNVSATYTLPGGQAEGTYTIQAVYNAGPDYQTSSDSTHTLAVGQSTTSTKAANAAAGFSPDAQSVTLSASVTSGGVGVSEGTVTFTVFAAGNVQVGSSVTSGTVSGGNASATYTLPAGQAQGTYTIEAVYNPGADYQGSSDSTRTLSVTKAATTTVASNATASFSTNSQTATLSATVSGGGVGASEGTVTFTLFTSGNVQVGSAVTSGTVTGGNASVTFTLPAGLAEGTYTIHAVYNPGNDYQGSSDNTHTLTVGQGATTTVATNVSTPYSELSRDVTLNATVTSGGVGVNEGTVTFTVFDDDNDQVGSTVTSGTVTGGQAAINFLVPDDLDADTYTIQAVYNPGPDYQASSDSSHTLTVTQAAVTTAAANATTSFSPNSQAVTLSAVILTQGVGVVEGSVTFTVLAAGNVPVGSPVTAETLTDGNASVTYPLPAGLARGTYTIQAVYNPSDDYFGGSDSSHTLTITQAATTTAAASATASFNPNSQTVTLSAAVTSGGVGVSEGTVTFTLFTAGNVQVGSPVTSGTVAAGDATANVTLPAGLAVGSYTIQAIYNAGPDYLTSGDSAHAVTVGKATTSVSVSNALVASSSNSQSLTLHATVTSGGTGVGQGQVTFTVFTAGNVQIGSPVTSGTVSGGTASASFTLPGGLAQGAYTVQAAYSGSADYQSVSGTGQLTVDVAPTFPAISPVSLPYNQFPASIPLDASSPVGLPLTYTTSVQGDNPLYDLEHRYQFTGLGYVTAGVTAYVLHSSQPGSAVGGYYLIRSDGALFAYDGSASYATTFANGTPLAQLGASAYTDPTLLLNAQDPVNYATLYSLQQQYQFTGVGLITAGASAYVLHSNQPGPGVAGYYLIRPDGALFAYDGASSFAATFANGTPLAQLGASVYSFPNDLLEADATPTLYATLNQLNRQYDLEELNGSFFTNTYGHEAQWLYSPILNQFGQHWYTLSLQTVNNVQQAVLTAWEGYQDSEVGAVLATLDPSVYSNPAELAYASAAPNPAVTTSVNGSNYLLVNLPAGYAGSFNVTVTASDGLLSASQTVLVTAMDSAPTLSVSQGSTPIPQGGTQTVPHLSSQTDTVTATAADGGTATTSAAVSAYSLPFTLQQLYQFKGLGYVTNSGTTAYVLQAAYNNSFGNPYYLLSTGGSLYVYDGSGSYSHTFGNVTPLATLGASFYTDPTLLLNSEPAVNYSTLYSLMQQYQFTGVGTATAGATAYILHSNQSGPGVGGYYLLSPAGGLYAYDGSGSFAHTFVDSTPLATLDPDVYVNPSILLNARANPAFYDQFNQLEQQYDLEELGGSFYTGLDGNTAKWLYSPIVNSNGQHWYTLVPAANGMQALLYAWDGGTNSIPASGQPLAVLDSSAYADPTLLINAKAPQAPIGVTASVSGGVLTLSAPSSFAGSFQVTLVASDGILSTTQTFQVNSTDTPPVPDSIPAPSASQSGAPVQLTLGATAGAGSTVTYSAQAVGYSAAYNLQQLYHFTGIGSVTVGGVTAYVLQSSVLGGVGGYYLLSSTGGVYAYDGSGSFAHTFANSANLITTLDPSVYNTPALLTNAQAPTAPAAVVSVSGDTLTVNVAGVPAGTVFQVIVTATDGAETIRTGFLVTVTA